MRGMDSLRAPAPASEAGERLQAIRRRYWEIVRELIVRCARNEGRHAPASEGSEPVSAGGRPALRVLGGGGKGADGEARRALRAQLHLLHGGLDGADGRPERRPDDLSSGSP